MKTKPKRRYITVAIPAELHEALKKKAKQDNRTLIGAIAAWLGV